MAETPEPKSSVFFVENLGGELGEPGYLSYHLRRAVLLLDTYGGSIFIHKNENLVMVEYSRIGKSVLKAGLGWSEEAEGHEDPRKALQELVSE